jgi:hypothetical protein
MFRSREPGAGNDRTPIVCKSVHHLNTSRVARAVGEVMNAEISAPEDVPDPRLDEHDLLGLGSGV